MLRIKCGYHIMFYCLLFETNPNIQNLFLGISEWSYPPNQKSLSACFS